MKTAIIVAILITLTVGALWAQTSESSQNKIKELEARIAELEVKVNALERTSKINYITIPAADLSSTSKPKPDWRPFEFQGQTFYYVPLNLGPATK